VRQLARCLTRAKGHLASFGAYSLSFSISFVRFSGVLDRDAFYNYLTLVRIYDARTVTRTDEALADSGRSPITHRKFLTSQPGFTEELFSESNLH
jgi:hypothetical protein